MNDREEALKDALKRSEESAKEWEHKKYILHPRLY